MPGTFLSPTPNAVSLTLGQLWTCFHNWEQSASLEESCTRMRVLIFTCSSISAPNTEAEELLCSMLTVGTRTLRLSEELLGRLTTMQSKMGTLCAGELNDQSNLRIAALRLLIGGLRLQVRRLDLSSGNSLDDLIRRLYAATLGVSASTATGNTLLTLPCTSTPERSRSLAENWMEETSGCSKLLLELREMEVSCLDRRYGGAPLRRHPWVTLASSREPRLHSRSLVHKLTGLCSSSEVTVHIRCITNREDLVGEVTRQTHILHWVSVWR